MSKYIGVDLSHYNKVTDFDALAGAVGFAFVKATQGRSLSGGDCPFCDGTFPRYIDELLSRGVKCGAYHFFTASDEATAIKEADYFCDQLEPYAGKIIYAVCDVENYNNKYLQCLDRTGLTATVNAFCKRVTERGFKAAYYTNTDHIKSKLNAGDINYPLWLAQYTNDATVALPDSATSAAGGVIAWQYTSSGAIAGVYGNVDVNIGFFDITEKEEDTVIGEILDNAPDEWAKEAVEWAINNDVLKGDENGNYKLHEACTREQMCVFMKRLYDFMK